LFTINARAETLLPPRVIANLLNGRCARPGNNNSSDCLSYLRGVADALGYTSNWQVCFKKADNQQLRIAFMLYASQHPDESVGPAVKMAQAAFIAHACK
jgi:hypothetical protein